MARTPINVGAANSKTGDTIRQAFLSTESNFVELYSNSFDSVVVVKNASDLSGTLDSTKVYIIDGVIDMGTQSIEVPAGGLSIRGFTFDASQLITTAPGISLFTSPVGGSGNLVIIDLGISVSNASSEVFNLTDATGFNAIELVSVNFNSCSSLGNIDGYRQGLETNTGRFGGTPELTLSGNWLGGYFINGSLIRSLNNYAGSIFKAGTGFVMNSRFRTNHNVDLPASTNFCDFSTSNFPNASTIELDSCIITRSGAFVPNDANLLPNLSPNDLQCKWRDNTGIRNTFEGGALIIVTETATTGVGSFTPLLGTYVTYDLAHFDQPSNGQLRHLGDTPTGYSIIGDITLESSSNNELELRVMKHNSSSGIDTQLFSIKRQVINSIGGEDLAIFTFNRNLELDKNDYVYLEVRNNTLANNITAKLDSTYVIQKR